MKKTCKCCKEAFEITEQDREFLTRMQVGEPTLCYFCRMIRRLAQRNERHLYHRKCDLSGRQIISHFSRDKRFPVYDIEVWWSDKWDELSYGRDFDFSGPSFFAQFLELRDSVPRMARQHQKPMENSDYCNCASRNKNCYLLFSTNRCEDCYYGAWVNDCKSCVDNLNLDRCELCYECVGCRECYDLRYSRDCTSCTSSLFLRDCTGCANCFGCTSLVNQEYCLYNERVGKERYLAFLSTLNTGSHQAIEKLRDEIESALGVMFVKQFHGTNVENSTGDYLRNCRNAHCCFELDNCEDMSYSMCLYNAKSSMDHSYWGGNSELTYECQACGYNLFNLRFCNLCWSDCSDLIYCDHCFSSKSCFGCVGLRRKEYCILNKQFSKEEYEKLVPRIIEHMKNCGEWGEFFPLASSVFAYNESVAQEHAPLSRKEALAAGISWHDEYDEKKNNYIGPQLELPDSIVEVDASICSKILRCEQTGRPYKIVEPEIEYYRRLKIPLPRICPDARHARRLTFRNPRLLWQKNCVGCGTEMLTCYAPARPEKVFCEKCYLEKVFR